jgi:hypothetical protein
VVANVEDRIVLPRRVRHREGREHHLLAIARQQVEARLERLDQDRQRQVAS